jgi:hypothetical protein
VYTRVAVARMTSHDDRMGRLDDTRKEKSHEGWAEAVRGESHDRVGKMSVVGGVADEVSQSAKKAVWEPIAADDAAMLRSSWSLLPRLGHFDESPQWRTLSVPKSDCDLP